MQAIRRLLNVRACLVQGLAVNNCKKLAETGARTASKVAMNSQPEVDAEDGGNDLVKYGIAYSQGYRPDMQDAHAECLDLKDNSHPAALFAVFDGHGGSAVAKYCADSVCGKLRHALAHPKKRKGSGPDLPAALREVILEMDREVVAKWPKRPGSTATLALLHANELVVAGVGDSRAILGREGRPVALTIDHKPTDPKEKERITDAGGYVGKTGRVQDNLNMSRALGDGQYKDQSQPPDEQIVSPEPDISQHSLDEKDDWFLVASDGLWNALSEGEVTERVYECLQEGMALGDIAKSLVASANRPSKTARDNVTVCIVQPSGARPDTDTADQDSHKAAKREGGRDATESDAGSRDAGGEGSLKAPESSDGGKAAEAKDTAQAPGLGGRRDETAGVTDDGPAAKAKWSDEQSTASAIRSLASAMGWHSLGPNDDEEEDQEMLDAGGAGL